MFQNISTCWLENKAKQNKTQKKTLELPKICAKYKRKEIKRRNIFLF